MDGTTAAAHCTALVKEADPARFVSALFAPEATRRRLLALYALDAELRRVPLAAREPMIVAIRYQWWRDAVTGLPEATRGHPVLGELALAGLPAADLIALIDAREGGAEPAIAEGNLIAAAARMCGAPDGDNPIAMAAGIAIVTGSRDALEAARAAWRAVRKARRAELPAYLPATFVDARHPVTAFRLHWRVLTKALRNRF